MRVSYRRALVLVLLLFVSRAEAQATEPVPPEPQSSSILEQLDRAASGGTWWLRLRYRVEGVDQDGFTREAWASTLRTVLGYESAPWHGASVVLEFEDVSVVGSERYNSTVNGKTEYPIVADPEGSEVNQVHLKYAPAEETLVKLGRQVLKLDNTRFVGDVAWRQNQQTFDAATVLWRPMGPLQVFYGFIGNVNRVFGGDSPQGDQRMASHLVNASWDFEGVGLLSGYGYLLDYDSVDTLSTNTVGARFTGAQALGPAELQYTAEAARQTDASGNPNDVDQGYLLGKLGAGVKGVTVEVGNELLGGSGDPGDAFQTPLATLHAFNGWADQFLTTPDTGLEDRWLGLGAKHGAFDFRVVWHTFQADSGGADYGTELDSSIGWAVGEKVTVGLKLADYRADDFAADTTKVWFWLTYAP